MCTTSFSVQKVYILPIDCNYVFYMDKRINSDYFPIHYKLIGFYN